MFVGKTRSVSAQMDVTITLQKSDANSVQSDITSTMLKGLSQHRSESLTGLN